MDTRCSISPKSEINITPYIDILLVLLIIFMVIQPATQYDLEARAPQKAKTNERTTSDVIVVSIDRATKLSINGETVSLDRLGNRLFEILSARSKKEMFVRGASDLPFGMVARVIDIAKGAGAGDVGLLRE